MSETRDLILKKSLLLFLQKSYKDVTMSEIVTNTGLSKGAFYHYFTSKEQLFREIAGSFFSMGAVDYGQISASAKSLKEFYGLYIEFLNNSLISMNALRDEGGGSGPINFFLIMFEAVSRFPEFLERELEMHKRDVSEWVKVIEMARENGEIVSKSSDKEIAELFLYCTDGVFLRYINNDNPMAYREFLTNTYDTIYNNISLK